MGFTDIHSHILPGLDDGAQSIEESIGIALEASANGISDIVATPHFGGRFDIYEIQTIEQLVDNLNNRLRLENINVKIHSGSENFCTPDIIEWAKDGQLITLAKSRYVLIDLPFNEIPIFLPELIFRLKLMGLTPVVAHIERNSVVQLNPNVLDQATSQGALLQVNSTSISGFLGAGPQKTSHHLLKNKKVHFIASDSHSASGRSPNFKEAQMIAEKFAEKHYTDKIMRHNPSVIIENGVIEI